MFKYSIDFMATTTALNRFDQFSQLVLFFKTINTCLPVHFVLKDVNFMCESR